MKKNSKISKQKCYYLDKVILFVPENKSYFEHQLGKQTSDCKFKGLNLATIPKIKRRSLDSRRGWPSGKTIIEIIKPNQAFLSFMSDLMSNKFYKFTEIEIKREQHYDIDQSEEEFAYCRMSYSNSHYTFQTRDLNSLTARQLNSRIKRGLFPGCKSHYSATKNIVLTGYRRKSKENKEDCYSVEIRIKKSKNIANQLGVKTIKDLVNFDEKKFFNEFYTKRVQKLEVKPLVLGRFFFGNLIFKHGNLKLSAQEQRICRLIDRQLNYFEPGELFSFLSDVRQKLKNQKQKSKKQKKQIEVLGRKSKYFFC
jgi:hypothetical protein